MKRHLILLMLCFFLSACAQQSGPGAVLTPMPAPSKDPADAVLIEAVTQFLHERGAPPNSQYDLMREDLNGDGLREGLILMKLPHNYWCGWTGCEMLIFKAGNNRFDLMSEVHNVRGPLFIAPFDDQTWGKWRDIVVRASGANTPDRTVVLKHDGQGYPENPLIAPGFSDPMEGRSFEKIFK